MLENYRSAPQVLSAANSLIAQRTGTRIAKDLLARRTLPRRPAGHLPRRADAPRRRPPGSPGEMRAAARAPGRAIPATSTVLYRARYCDSRAVEEAFIREQIPHTVYSGTPFFARREVKDALSYLRLIATKNDLDFRRVANVPKRNLGAGDLKYLEEAAEREGTTLYEALEAHIGDDIFKGTGAADFLNLAETFSATYAERPVSAVLADLLQASGYAAAAQPHAAGVPRPGPRGQKPPPICGWPSRPPRRSSPRASAWPTPSSARAPCKVSI